MALSRTHGHTVTQSFTDCAAQDELGVSLKCRLVLWIGQKIRCDFNKWEVSWLPKEGCSEELVRKRHYFYKKSKNVITTLAAGSLIFIDCSSRGLILTFPLFQQAALAMPSAPLWCLHTRIQGSLKPKYELLGACGSWGAFPPLRLGACSSPW